MEVVGCLILLFVVAIPFFLGLLVGASGPMPMPPPPPQTAVVEYQPKTGVRKVLKNYQVFYVWEDSTGTRIAPESCVRDSKEAW